MAPGGGDLEGPLRRFLSPDVGEIELGGWRNRLGRLGGRAGSHSAERLGSLGECSRPIDAKPLHQRTFRRVLLGDDQALEPALARLERDGEHTAHRQQVSGQCQLPRKQRRAVRQRDEPGGGEDPERDGQIEPRAFLAQLPGSEIDGDLLLGKLISGIAQGGEHPRARVVAGVIR